MEKVGSEEVKAHLIICCLTTNTTNKEKFFHVTFTKKWGEKKKGLAV